MILYFMEKKNLYNCWWILEKCGVKMFSICFIVFFLFLIWNLYGGIVIMILVLDLSFFGFFFVKIYLRDLMNFNIKWKEKCI